jgi:DNA polymerase-3 subunit delta
MAKEVSVFGRTLLVVGPESLVAERLAGKRVAIARKERPDAAVSKVAAGDLDAGMLAEISGASLLSSAAIVVVGELPGLPAELTDQLAELAADPGPDLALVLLHPGGVKGKGLVDRVKKSGAEIAEAPAVKAWELPQFAIAEAKALKGRIDQQAASVLVDAVGSELRSVAAAVRQLLDDSEDRTITEAEVRKYFTGRAESTSYAVADDAINGRTSEALGKLRWALVTGVPPVLVTAAFASSLRSLGKYLDAADPHIRDGDLARQIGVPPWKVKDLAKQARDWRESGVAQAIKAAALADAQVKGAAVDAGFALEQLVMRVSGLRVRR